MRRGPPPRRSPPRARQRPRPRSSTSGYRTASGVELACELAALPVPPRVVLVSTDADAVSPEDIRRCGASAFIPKQDLPNAPWQDLLGSR